MTRETVLRNKYLLKQYHEILAGAHSILAFPELCVGAETLNDRACPPCYAMLEVWDAARADLPVPTREAWGVG
jgi:hypothetical protein